MSTPDGTADAIVVLGRGINADGSLPRDPRERVRTAVRLFREGRAAYLIASGRWSFHLDSPPPRSEAAAMGELAVELGVPRERILLDEASMDTISNAYFVKTALLAPRDWKNVLVVTSEDHAERSELDFRFVLGTSYRVEVIASPLTIEGGELEAVRAKEARSLWITKKLLEGIAPGDDESVRNLIYTYVPGFADRTEADSKIAPLFEEYERLLSGSR